MAVTGGLGAYLFYFNFNDTADQINEGVNELAVKFKKDTTRLYTEMNTLKKRISTLEKQLQSSNESTTSNE